MEKSVPIGERIGSIVRLAIGRGIVSNQKEFAKLVGITEQQLTNYIKGKNKPGAEKLSVMNAAVGGVFNNDWVQVGIGDVLADAGGNIIKGDSNTVGIPAKKFENEREWFVLVSEKDKQIDRLLTIIEKMQQQ